MTLLVRPSVSFAPQCQIAHRSLLLSNTANHLAAAQVCATNNQQAAVVSGRRVMNTAELLEKAAALRDLAKRALRLAEGVNGADFARLTKYAAELREQATELERQAAAEVQPRPTEQDSSPSGTQNGQQPKKGRGSSNDPEPQI